MSVTYSTTDEDGQKKSVLYKVKPPYRYTDGKLVDYKNQAQVEKNIRKNQEFAKTIMSRCMMSRKEAERIVYKTVVEERELQQYEQKLLDEGDSYLSVEKEYKLNGKNKYLPVEIFFRAIH